MRSPERHPPSSPRRSFSGLSIRMSIPRLTSAAFTAFTALAVSGTVLATTGCSFAAVADGADADGISDTSSTHAALVTIERTSDSAKAEVVARVVRVGGIGSLDEPALRLAGFADDLSTAKGALGTCTTGSRSASVPAAPVAAVAAGGNRNLELLDLGQVALDLGDGIKTPLVARHVPDPAGVLSGVMYNARIGEAGLPGLPGLAGLPASGAARASVRAAGAPNDPESVGFVAQVAAPADVANLRFAGQDPKDFSASQGPIEVTWLTPERLDRSDRIADLEDLVLFEVRGTDPSRPMSRCTFPDTGRAIVPIAVDEGTVVVHRIHRERFHLDFSTPKARRDRDEGEIRFDTSRTIAFTRSGRGTRP